MSAHTCAACDEPIEKRASVCPDCGNSPRRDLGLSLVVIALGVAVGSIVFPPLLVVSLLALVAATIAYGSARWLYPARKYDFRFGIGFDPSGPGEKQSG